MHANFLNKNINKSIGSERASLR